MMDDTLLSIIIRDRPSILVWTAIYLLLIWYIHKKETRVHLDG